MNSTTYTICVYLTPDFNAMTTMAFIDPFRAANYLKGEPLYKWVLISERGGQVAASNGTSFDTVSISEIMSPPHLIIVSSSWEPNKYSGAPLANHLRRWDRFGAVIGGLDTGSFILAANGLLEGQRAAIHYEHIDTMLELFPKVETTENLYEITENRMTSAGGVASTDLALSLIQHHHSDALANMAARYIFHPIIRPADTKQNIEGQEPIGASVPKTVQKAIKIMEGHLEETLKIPQICGQLEVSQRQLERLFFTYIGKSPSVYYRDIRLDRAKSLITQTEMPISEIALACGFPNAVHFSRSYKQKYGATAMHDRKNGRLPFEYRAWPMHPGIDVDF